MFFYRLISQIILQIRIYPKSRIFQLSTLSTQGKRPRAQKHHTHKKHKCIHRQNYVAHAPHIKKPKNFVVLFPFLQASDPFIAQSPKHPCT